MENSLQTPEFPTDRLPSPTRRPYIDWLRGLAVLFMIEWHTVDAWLADAARTGRPFGVLAFIGGWAAPLFLFLAGVAIPFAAGSHMRKGRSMAEAAWVLQKRGWQVFFYAHLFRFTSFLFNPWARGDSIFKPDILNILGLGLVAGAWCWGRSATIARRVLWLLVPAAVIVLISPLVRGWWWPTLLHPRLEAYLRPNGGWGQFALFPWVAYVFVGACAGVWIATARKPEDEPRFHARLAMAAAAVMVAGWVGMYLPSPLGSSFWTTSLSYFLIRTGAMTLMLALAWLWMTRPTARHWSPTVLFGQTSLFVYWVHVELAYGIFSLALKRSLTLPQMGVAYLLFTALMLVAAAWWAKRTAAGPWIPEHLKA